VGAVALIGVTTYTLWPAAPPDPPPASVATPPDRAVDARLVAARISLDAKHYRTALAQAGEVLAIDAQNAEATKIRDEARGMLARFDTAIARARERLHLGDLAGMARALEEARTIEAASPAVAEISERFFELKRRKDDEARNAAARPRPEAPSDRRSSRGSEPQAATPTAGAAQSRGDQAKPADPTAKPTEPSAKPSGEGAKPPGEPARPPVQDPPPAAPPVAPPAAPPPAPASPPVLKPPASETTAPVKPPRSGPTPEEDEAAIRKVVAILARAVETKDIALYRTVRPNLSRQDEKRVRDGFNAVRSQRVTITVLSIDPRGDSALVRVLRQDVAEGQGGERKDNEIRQTLTFARTATGWIITTVE
jgi:hypothetical protein